MSDRKAVAILIPDDVVLDVPGFDVQPGDVVIDHPDDGDVTIVRTAPDDVRPLILDALRKYVPGAADRLGSRLYLRLVRADETGITVERDDEP